MIKTTVLLCSANRPDILNETVQGLFQQSVVSIKILISAPDKASVPSNLKLDPRVEVITDAPRGLCCQRNAGIAKVSTPCILFVDDDVELRSNYIAAMEALFDGDSTVILSTGQVIADGVTSDGGINREQARQLLSQFTSKPLKSHDEAYGCNMFVRTEIAKQRLFDDVLPLYGWLEDYDFSIRCRQLGRIVLG
jgi:GT2 family glycosyltransferase